MGKDSLTAGLVALNALERAEGEAAFLRCCGAPRWARTMERMRPFHTPASLAEAATDVWNALTPHDWLQAFTAHPRIGARAPTGSWSAAEQAGAAGADEDVLNDLAALNAEYEARFGFVFIICATGRSADAMLAELSRRIENTPQAELENAATEQDRITRLRLDKLLREIGDH